MPAFCQKVGLGWCGLYVSMLVGESWGMKTIEHAQEGWLITESYSIDSLQSASLDMDVDVNDAITISDHCMQLDYYSMQITWLDILSHYSHIISFFKCLIFPKKFSNNARVPSCVLCTCEVVCGRGKGKFEEGTTSNMRILSMRWTAWQRLYSRSVRGMVVEVRAQLHIYGQPLAVPVVSAFRQALLTQPLLL